MQAYLYKQVPSLLTTCDSQPLSPVIDFTVENRFHLSWTSGILHAEGKDYKTAHPCLYETFENLSS